MNIPAIIYIYAATAVVAFNPQLSCALSLLGIACLMDWTKK